MGPRLLFFLRRQGSWCQRTCGIQKVNKKKVPKASKGFQRCCGFRQFDHFSPQNGKMIPFWLYVYIYTYLFFFSDGWLIEAPTVVWFCSCQSEVWRMHQDEQEEQVGHKPSGPPPKKTNPAALGCFSVLKMDWIIANRNKNNHEIVHDSHIFLKPFDAWSHLPLFLVGLSKGCTSPICQGDASRIGSIYGPLLLGEVVEKSSISILVKQTTWYEGNSKYMEFPRVKPGKTQR